MGVGGRSESMAHWLSNGADGDRGIELISPSILARLPRREQVETTREEGALTR